MLTDQDPRKISEIFYDASSEKALVDYVHQNLRLTAALRHALRWMPPDSRRILDIGCGIGWSTWEIAKNHPNAFALGIDLSSKRVEIAQQLFDGPNLAYATHDVTRWDESLTPPFDAVVMLDVYEHIRDELRDEFHVVLSKVLGKQGVVILTFPSLFHQSYLRLHQPEGLQPVDEDVTVDDIFQLARFIDGYVSQFSHVSIWNANDYVHAVIQRTPDSVPSNRKDRRNESAVMFEPEHKRTARVSSRLKLAVTRGKFVLPDGRGPIVCIISPNRRTYSETFIRAHIERLPARIRVLYGGDFPHYRDDGTPLLPTPGPATRIWRAIWRRVQKLPGDHFEQAALKQFLLENGIDAVLAEYGPTGVAVMDACKDAHIPLITYFRGYDVYSRPVLERVGKRYPKLVGNAAAIIAVSHDIKRRLAQEYGALPGKLYVNPSGVDTKLFKGADPEHAPPLFVAVGRFVDKKAPQLTLLAFKEVVARIPDARLIMIGDGPLLEACKHIAKAMRISGAVEFLGSRSHPEVAAALQRARAFVQHSITASDGDSEGTPNAVKEAGASGLPVVATSHGGIPEIVVDGETGFLVGEGDTRGMTERMIKLAQDPILAAQMGRAARKHVCAEYSMEQSISDLWKVMEKVIRDSTGSPLEGHTHAVEN